VSITFPSREFDEAVAAVCHGSVSEEQARALNLLLRRDAAARDEYILRLELHSRLASDPALFVSVAALGDSVHTNQDVRQPSPSPLNGERAGVRGGNVQVLTPRSESLGGTTPHPQSLSPLRGEGGRRATVRWVVSLAACLALLAGSWWMWRVAESHSSKHATSTAVAMLSRVADAQWTEPETELRLGAPIEPGWLRLKSGLAQIVFYNGARVVIEGPTELQLISPSEALCRSGRLTAEVPPQASGFRVRTPQMNVTDLGTAFGLDVKETRTELHVFEGRVEFQTGTTKRDLKEGAGAVAERARDVKLITADPTAFASLFDLQMKSSDAAVLRHEQWRAASHRLDEDSSLLVHFDFDASDSTDYRLLNTSKRPGAVPDATIIGCKWIEGRWPDKRALEFGGVSDRVRFSVPGEYESLTLTAWVRVQGLDRRVNSLFMSDGFIPGTLHWLILNDGAPTVTVVGPPGKPVQIVTGPPVVTLDKFGLWQHVAVVVDSRSGNVVHYLNGEAVSETPLRIKPPFRVGPAELGNWNPSGFKGDESLMIRNFSGAMDEFCLFGRALPAHEIRALYSQGKPQPDPVAARE
jgi:hypothetical protein